MTGISTHLFLLTSDLSIPVPSSSSSSPTAALAEGNPTYAYVTVGKSNAGRAGGSDKTAVSKRVKTHRGRQTHPECCSPLIDVCQIYLQRQKQRQKQKQRQRQKKRQTRETTKLRNGIEPTFYSWITFESRRAQDEAASFFWPQSG